jgi:hypothetical protein
MLRMGILISEPTGTAERYGANSTSSRAQVGWIGLAARPFSQITFQKLLYHANVLVLTLETEYRYSSIPKSLPVIE